MNTNLTRAAHRITVRMGASVAVVLVGVAALGLGWGPTARTGVAGVPEVTPVAVPSPMPMPGPSSVPSPSAAPTISRPVVVLYGDSLAWEAQDEFVAAFAGRTGVQVVARTFGGTAICDFLDKMRADARDLRPGAVVVEFSGNAFTPCMLDAAGQALSGAAYDDRYRTDAVAVMDVFAPIGAHVWFAGAPVARPDGGRHFNGGKLDPMYRALALARPGVVDFVDAGAAVLDQGRWTATLPCRRHEPCEGGSDSSGRAVNVVRAPDGDHFCPASDAARTGVTGRCPVWSSGAFRYGRAMAAPVIDALAGSGLIVRPDRSA